VGLLVDGVPLSGRTTQRRRLALLALLAAAGEAGMRRDKLLAFLWPERNSAGARHSLSQTLYAIRQELGADVFTLGVDSIRLNRTVITSDVAELRAALANADAERVVALYAGAFLDGFFIDDAPEFERWADEQRQQLAESYGGALEALARGAAGRGDTRSAAAWWGRRAALDPLDAAVALELVRARSASGDTAGALQHVRTHATLMREELNAGPDPALEEFAASLLRKRPSVREDAAAIVPAAVSTAAVAPSQAVDDTGVPERASSTDAAAAAAARVRQARRRMPRAATWIGAIGLAAGLIVAAVAYRTGTADGAAPVRHLLLAELELTGTDAGLGLAVREALRAELESDPAIRLVPESRVRETLALMRQTGSPVTGPIALAIAQRQGVSLVVSGSVGPLGTGAQVLLQLRDARTEEVLATIVERPLREEDVIPAVARAAAGLRRTVSGARVETALPLPAATTTSLPALRNYALARQALYEMDRANALLHGEAALVHDSTFALAHYLVGDLLWYIDEQRHSDEHIQRAYDLSASLPPRERLIVRARYEQLIRDEPDSAIAYWRLLAASYPDEPLAYEGLRWAYRALGQWELMAEASDSALKRDSTWLRFHFEDRLTMLLQARDSAGALALAARYADRIPHALGTATMSQAFSVQNWAVADSMASIGYGAGAYTRHLIAAHRGDLDAARRYVHQVRRSGALQERLRVYILQARLELEPGGSPDSARALLRRTLTETVAADLSPPAWARLMERIADGAARARDTATIAAARAFLVERDGGRALRSYTAALQAIDAYAAFARGDYARAAELAGRTAPTRYYGRSIATLLALEADALAALGRMEAADSVGALIRSDTLRDTDGEIVGYFRRLHQ
jgi:DNA-binding SARP family transcriptional activator